jgi:hypothetical protein
MHDKVMAANFLAALDPAAQRFTFQFFSDGDSGYAEVVHGSLDEVWPKVQALNTIERRIGVFVTINETDLKGRRRENIVRPRALFVDADGAEQVQPCRDAIRDTGAIPSIVVQSSAGRAHFYWCCDDLTCDVFSTAQSALIARLGTDPAVKDLPRVMRLPGTLHLKNPNAPRMVRLFLPIPTRRWKFCDLTARLGLAVAPSPSRTHRTDPAPLPADNELGAGIKLNLDEIRSAVAAIPPTAIASEENWVRLARGLAHAAFVYPEHAEKLWSILDQASQRAPHYDPDENRTRWDRYVNEASNRNQPITIATVFWMARTAGWQGLPAPAVTLLGNNSAAGNASGARMPLKGGVYDEKTALTLFNSHFFVALVKGACPIAQIQDDQTITYIAPKDFALLVRNISVFIKGKPMQGDRFWLAHPDRHQRRVVFRPGASAGPDEYNLWRGFGVTPAKGWSRQRRLLRHIFQVICRREKTKFKYLLRWLAWGVQNPDKRAETVVVLQSRAQGTGKTTLSQVMRDIFGAHGRTVISKARLLSQFNSDFETVCWVSGEEMLWAGDKGAADAVKSMITGDTVTLEVKNGPRWDVPNRLHLLLTTNHVHAVAAGTNERRHFVLEVSDEKAQQRSWFDPLYADLENGGIEQFLWLLQNIHLGSWHPRQLPKTAETLEQQRMSADSIVHWATACCDADSILSPYGGGLSELSAAVETQDLLASYTEYCRRRGFRCVDDRRFGKALTAMFGSGARKRLSPSSGRKGRPYAYDVPDGDSWRRAIDKYLGIS